MTLRLSRELEDRLERLAASTRRSRSYLAAAAIAAYVDRNAWQVEAIGEAVEGADAGGPSVGDADANAYLDALPRGEDPVPPKAAKARQAGMEIRWLDDALADVTEPSRYVAADEPGAAAAVVERIQEAVRLLAPE